MAASPVVLCSLGFFLLFFARALLGRKVKFQEVVSAVREPVTNITNINFLLNCLSSCVCVLLLLHTRYKIFLFALRMRKTKTLNFDPLSFEFSNSALELRRSPGETKRKGIFLLNVVPPQKNQV